MTIALLFLFICKSTMLNCTETLVGRKFIDRFSQKSARLCHCSITTIFQNSFIESSAAEFLFIEPSIIATEPFAVKTQHSEHLNSTLKTPGCHVVLILCIASSPG